MTLTSPMSHLCLPKPLLQGTRCGMYGYRRRLEIQDSIPVIRSLCKYAWEIDVCMVLTGKGCLGQDIWPETPQQAESMESIMRTMWNTEAI